MSERVFPDPKYLESQSLPHPQAHILTGVQPAGEGQGAVLHIKGEVIDVKGAGGHYLQGLVVLNFTVVMHIHVRDVRRLSHVHAGQGKGINVWAEEADPCPGKLKIF